MPVLIGPAAHKTLVRRWLKLPRLPILIGREGEHHFNLALGHGGQQIVLLDEFDMVFVVTADPFHAKHNSNDWKHEKANLKLVADFIGTLPSE